MKCKVIKIWKCNEKRKGSGYLFKPLAIIYKYRRGYIEMLFRKERKRLFGKKRLLLDFLIPLIIVIVVLIVSLILFFILAGKGTGALEYFKNLWRFR